MANDGQSVERLRQYLRTLKPEARVMLVVALERGQLRGDASVGNGLVLQELRRTIRAEAQKVPRVADIAGLFFTPLEPFVIDDAVDRKYVGRIARASLAPIWGWIGRDLMPEETKALTDDIRRALLVDDQIKADQLVRALQERAIHRMKDALAAVSSDEKAQRRLAIQVGTPRALDDVAKIIDILEFRDVLADLAWRLPNHIRAFDRDQIDAVKAHLDCAVAAKPLDGVAPSRSDILLVYGLVMVANRLATPWQLIRIATCAADSDDPSRIAATPYAAAVTVAFSELERIVGELRSEFRAGRPIASVLKDLHDAARALRTELNLSVDSVWSRQLATIRSEVSGLLKSEIEITPGRLRRLLSSRQAMDVVPGSLLNEVDVDDADMGINLVIACRNYASELALSESTSRVYADLTQYLEVATKALLESLRHAQAADRPFRQSQVDAAIRFCRTVYGGEYAGLLAKAAEVAVQAAASEHKSIRA